MGATRDRNRRLWSRGRLVGYRRCDPNHRPAGAGSGGRCRGGLLLFAGMSWRARPKLAITPDGLALRGWFRTQLLQQSDIKIIRIIEFRRYGRKVRLLEVETADGGLVLFSRWDLGTDPLDVLDALTAAGYAGRSQP